MTNFDERKKTIGARIRAEREKLGLSRKELLPKIYKSEKSHKTLAAWEDGDRLPDVDSLALMAELFNCDIGYLLGDYDEHRRVTADVCAETGLSERAADWICRIHQQKPGGAVLSEQLLDALSSLVTADEFSFVLRDIAGLKSVVRKSKEDVSPISFSEEFQQWDYVEKISHEVPKRTNGKYVVLPAKGYIDTLKFRLSKAFNSVIDEIVEEAVDNG